jgi:hypothetical protein
MEQEEHEKKFEDFTFVHNSAVSLRKLFEDKKTITIFWKEEENENISIANNFAGD